MHPPFFVELHIIVCTKKTNNKMKQNVAIAIFMVLERVKLDVT